MSNSAPHQTAGITKTSKKSQFHGHPVEIVAFGLADVPVIVLSHLTPTQRRALMIADNKIAENAGWDEQCWPQSLRH